MKEMISMYKFDAEKVRDELVRWIRGWFEVNGKGCVAVVGIKRIVGRNEDIFREFGNYNASVFFIA